MKRLAIDILTNGRPNHQHTLDFLRKSFKGDVQVFPETLKK